jgi:3',5'-cyclic AMP phosphodiesterase CpdA
MKKRHLLMGCLKELRRAGLSVLAGLLPCMVEAHEEGHGSDWVAKAYAEALDHAPRPMPDRVVLTWTGDPSTTQAVTWRTDTTIEAGFAQIAVANSNGYALRPETVVARMSEFESDLNEAHYFSVTFSGLQPNTLYTYRVGDGVNWSEYFHFRTAERGAKPFSFIYFGDAQNDVKTHWSRVFREAFRDAPRAAFTLHAGDLINLHGRDAEWGEWHRAPAWVNGTVPVIAVPGNHEYYREYSRPLNERYWNDVDGNPIPVWVESKEEKRDGIRYYELVATTESGQRGTVVFEADKDRIVSVDAGALELTRFTEEALLGKRVDRLPLQDRPRESGVPLVSRHWRHQFAFPVQDPPSGLEETCYYIDYQDVRIICLDSNTHQVEQVPWLRAALEENPARWTIVTFHHPIFSPGGDRDNEWLRGLWKPLFDEFRVDLVLNGHDHTYARTGALEKPVSGSNLPEGYQQAYDPEVGTVYVVSVSGPKMYAIGKPGYARRVAEDTQLYQVISIAGDTLSYEARTAVGELYDTFVLRKRSDGQPNALIEALPMENRRSE